MYLSNATLDAVEAMRAGLADDVSEPVAMMVLDNAEVATTSCLGLWRCRRLRDAWKPLRPGLGEP